MKGLVEGPEEEGGEENREEEGVGVGVGVGVRVGPVWGLDLLEGRGGGLFCCGCCGCCGWSCCGCWRGLGGGRGLEVGVGVRGEGEEMEGKRVWGWEERGRGWRV